MRLSTRRWVREVRGEMVEVRLRFWRIRRVTRLWRQETPSQVEEQGLEVEFQVVRMVFDGSEVDFRRRSGVWSGCCAVVVPCRR